MKAEAQPVGWTNTSVLAFADGADPLVAASQASEGLLARARELGLAGPPLDILGLVRALGIGLLAGTRLSASEIRIDYVALSRQVDPAEPLARLGHGERLAGAHALSRIVAVGQTARGDISIDNVTYHLQAVGTPAYPGGQGARILALLEPDAAPSASRVEHVLADLTDTNDPNVMFVQVSSDSVRAWSRMGVGARLASQYPDFATSYRMWTLSDPSHLELGAAHIIERPDGDRRVAVATLVAQEGYGAGRGQLSYDALAEGLQQVRATAGRSGAVVHVPRLGAGQAGGRWDIIEGLLDSILAENGIRVVVHTKPHQGVTR